ncbi:MAG: cytidylate kinase-like family protein [Candidatus Sulfopaludibacter sp.]|nr:cytidylate kinase-like family protein [Candidatus Sulfopaludibacter sp.]
MTIAREYGSGGGAIAERIAKQLGWELLDRKLIEAIAQTADVDTEMARRYDERVDSWFHRINRGGLENVAIEAGAPPEEAMFFDAERMAAFAKRVISDAGARGQCVIVGRGGQCVLQNHPETLHVFVYAPWSDRVVRAARRVASQRDIEDVIRLTDQARARHIRRYFGRDWKDPQLYHLMIGSHLGDEEVVRTIIQVIERSGATSAAGSVLPATA